MREADIKVVGFFFLCNCSFCFFPLRPEQRVLVPLRNSRHCYGGVTRKPVSSVNNMLPGAGGANLPVAVASLLWSCFKTSRLASWKRCEFTVVHQQRRQRVTSETTCVKNSGPKCCVCCQRPPMARLSTVRATQVSCHTGDNTCAMFRQDRLRSQMHRTALTDFRQLQMKGK